MDLSKISNKLSAFFTSPEKKYPRMVLYLALVGFVLRFIAARNIDVLADDMVYASQSAGIFGASLISTHSNPPLFFYLTDLAYKVFGYSTIASRLWPLLAGTLLIPLTYLICNKLLNNRKIAFFASFFVAMSSFLIRMTFTEQSLVVLFFALGGVYGGMLFMEKRNIFRLLFVSSFFGLALLTKYNAPFFIFSFILYSAWYVKSNKLFPKEITLGKILIFILILVIFSLPFLSFNYILYKQKGIVDVYFSRLIPLESTQNLYAGLGGQENSFFDNLVNPSNYGNYKLPFLTDTLLVIFGLYGMWLLFKKHKNEPLIFILIFLIIPFILQSAGAPLQKHFTFMYIFLAIPAGVGLESVSRLIKSRNLKIALFSLIILFMLFSLGIAQGTPSSYTKQGPNAELKEFINSEVSDSSLLVFDSRIYTARTVWLATDKAYLSFDQAASFFNQVQAQDQTSAPLTNVYFVECVVEDCGWGWVASNQNLNITSERIIDSVADEADIVKKINYNEFNGNEFKPSEEKEYYIVYQTSMRMSSSYLDQIKSTQSFYFTPYLYKNMNNYLYNYKTFDPFSALLNNFSNIIILLSVLLAILSLILIIIFFLVFS